MANSPVGRAWLALPWLILATGIPLLLWWAFEPVPLEVNYVSPHFLSRPAIDRNDAETAAVTEAVGGRVLYRYVSYCVSRPFTATAHRSWVGKALVWPAPDLPTMLSRTPGCFETNIAVEIPTSSPSRSFSFVQTMSIEMSPIRTEVIQYPPIPLRILDANECKG
jgi:hypothetical protein